MVFKTVFCVSAGILGTIAYDGEQPPPEIYCDYDLYLYKEDVHHSPGAPQNVSDCIDACFAHCSHPTDDLSCLVNDALAGCRFHTEKYTYYDTNSTGCAPLTFLVPLPALRWSSFFDLEIIFDGFFQVWGDISAKNTTDCSTTPKTQPPEYHLMCNRGMGQCPFLDWVEDKPGVLNFFGVDNTGDNDLQNLTSVRINYHRTVYGESSTCKSITDEKQCNDAGCYYCNNLDSPTYSGYTGCGVSPSECPHYVPPPTSSTTSTTSTSPSMSEAVSKLTCNGQPTRFQLMNVQDVTADYQADLPIIQDQLPRVIETLQSVNTESVFGLVQFRDRSFADGVTPTGGSGMACVEISSPLTSSLATFEDVLTWPCNQSSPADLREDAWSGAYYAAVNGGWKAPIDGVHDRRVIVIATNEGCHYPGDDSDYGGDAWSFQNSHPSFQYGSTVNCTTEYPDFDTVSKKLIENDIYLVMVLRDSAQYYAGVDSSIYWHDLIQQKSPDLLERTTFVSVDAKSSNLYSAVIEGLSNINCKVAPSLPTTTTTTMSAEASKLTCNGVPTRFQLMSVQDVTYDYQADLPAIQDQLPKLLETLQSINSESVFGLAQFRDRSFVDGVTPSGGSGMACVEISSPLTNSVTKIQDVLTWPCNQSSPADLREDAWSGAFYAAMNAGWKTPMDGVQDRRVIVVATNEGCHYLGDESDYSGDAWSFQTSHHVFQYDNIVDCTTEYPDFNTVSKRLVDNDIYLLLLLRNSAQYYAGVNTSSYWFDIIMNKNRDLLDRTAIVSVQDKSSNLYDALIEGLTNINCNVAPPLH